MILLDAPHIDDLLSNATPLHILKLEPRLPLTSSNTAHFHVLVRFFVPKAWLLDSLIHWIDHLRLEMLDTVVDVLVCGHCLEEVMCKLTLESGLCLALVELVEIRPPEGHLLDPDLILHMRLL